MKNKKPKVGQTVYYHNLGMLGEQNLTDIKVTKVGRLYFYCNDGPNEYTEIKVSLENWKDFDSNYCSRYQFYASEQDYKDKKEISYLVREISADVWGHNSLEDLRKIKKILDGDTDD